MNGGLSSEEEVEVEEEHVDEKGKKKTVKVKKMVKKHAHLPDYEPRFGFISEKVEEYQKLIP